MDCADLHKALLEGSVPSEAELAAHLEGCAPCAELVADGGALGRRLAEAEAEAVHARGDNLAELLDQVEGAVRAERGPVAWLRSRSTEQRVALGLAAGALIAVGELLRKPRPDLAVYPMTTLLFEVTAYGLVLGLSMHFALRPLQRHAPPDWTAALLALLALGVPAVLAAYAPAHVAHAASLEGAGSALVQRALGCFTFGAAIGTAMLVLLRALDRGAHGTPAAVVVAAPVAGLVGNLALHMHCPITQQSHLFAGHVTVGFALLFVYSAVAHWLARRLGKRQPALRSSSS